MPVQRACWKHKPWAYTLTGNHLSDGSALRRSRSPHFFSQFDSASCSSYLQHFEFRSSLPSINRPRRLSQFRIYPNMVSKGVTRKSNNRFRTSRGSRLSPLIRRKRETCPHSPRRAKANHQQGRSYQYRFKNSSHDRRPQDKSNINTTNQI